MLTGRGFSQLVRSHCSKCLCHNHPCNAGTWIINTPDNRDPLMTHTTRSPNQGTRASASQQEGIPCGDGGRGGPTACLRRGWWGRAWSLSGGGRWQSLRWSLRRPPGRQGAVVSGNINPWRVQRKAMSAVWQHVVAVVHGCHRYIRRDTF